MQTFFRYTILSFVLFTTVFFYTFGPVALNTQPRTAHAQSGLISALGSGASQGMATCAASVGTSLLGSIAGNLAGQVVGGLLGSINPLSVNVSDGGTQSGVQSNTMERTIREGCLDAIMFYAAREVLNQLADSTLVWVESGFTRWGQTGNPGHVRNIGDYLNNTTDSVFNEFYRDAARGGEIERPNSEICGTYREEVMLALSRTHYGENPDPTGLQPPAAFERGLENTTDQLEEWEGNVPCPDDSIGATATDAFLSGDFSEGGWDAFNYSVENPDANPVGAYLNQNARLTQRIRQARTLDREELSQGNGWMNAVACPDSAQELDDRTGKCEGDDGVLYEPVVTTPGSVVNDTINNTVGSDLRRLELADEVNEIVGALIDQMISGIIGVGGSNRQGLFDPDLAQTTDTLGSSQSNQTDSGQGNYRGRVPEQFINERLDEQLPLETELQEALDVLPSTTDLDRVVARVNQCITEGTLDETTEPTADKAAQQLTTLQQARLGALPNRGEGEEEDEVGPQKVDWVGNNMNWGQGEIYGIDNCSEHRNAYGMSYVPDQEDGVWRGYICLPNEGDELESGDQKFGGHYAPTGGEGTDQQIDRIGNTEKIEDELGHRDHLGDIQFTEKRDLYRPPINGYVKVDWFGAEYDWKYHDMLSRELPVLLSENTGAKYLVNNIPEPLVDNNDYEELGYFLNVPGPMPLWDGGQKAEQIRRRASNEDGYRYGATECDPRTIGEKSYVVAPDQDENNPENIVWTEQECRSFTESNRGWSNTLFRFVTLYEDGNPVTHPAYARRIEISRIDDYKRAVDNLVGSPTDLTVGDYSKTDEVDNLHELRFDFATIFEETTTDDLAADPLIATSSDVYEDIRNKVHHLPELDEGSDDSINRRKQMIDARYAGMERRFHSEDDLEAAQDAAEHLSRDSSTSTYAQLYKTAEDFNCTTPPGWEPDSGEGEGEGEEEGEEEAPLTITSFNAYRQRDFSTGFVIRWASNADTCQAESTPSGIFSGPQSSTGQATADYGNTVTVRFTCTRDGDEVSEQATVGPARSELDRELR